MMLHSLYGTLLRLLLLGGLFHLEISSTQYVLTSITKIQRKGLHLEQRSAETEARVET